MIFDASDYKSNRIAAALGYLIFFIPLLMCSSSRLGRFAANQGLLGFIAYLVVCIAFWMINLLLGWIPLVGGLLTIVGYLVRLLVVGVMVYYGYQCYRGEAKPLPYIGHVELFR